MQYERAKYEFPIPDIDRRARADALAGIFLLDGGWHLAAHDSSAEDELLAAGALLIATLSFKPAGRPTSVVSCEPAAYLHVHSTSS